MLERLCIDVIVLTRESSPLAREVALGLRIQSGVDLRVHRHVGERLETDRTRWEAIARARNQAKSLGAPPFVMFLDDDVALGPGAVQALAEALIRRQGYAALAADYLGQTSPLGQSIQTTRHVAMGATLFRRVVLERIRFRYEDQKCECQCCCDDLRRMGHGVAYVKGAAARHVGLDRPGEAGANHSSPPSQDYSWKLAPGSRARSVLAWQVP